MIQVFSQLLSAALGSVGFGLIFNLNRRYLPAAGVGGLLAWLAYLLAANTLHSVFLANLLAGFCANGRQHHSGDEKEKNLPVLQDRKSVV